LGFWAPTKLKDFLDGRSDELENFFRVGERTELEGKIWKNWGLTRIARSHSWRMSRARKIWHGDGVHQAGSSLSHKSFWDFIKSIFYKGCSGENVGLMYQDTVQGFKHPIRTTKDIALAQHKSWMRSSGHRANMLNSDFSLIGVGVVRNKNGYYC